MPSGRFVQVSHTGCVIHELWDEPALDPGAQGMVRMNRCCRHESLAQSARAGFDTEFLQIRASISCDQSQNHREDYGANHGNDDANDETVFANSAETKVA
jgi:hypothetical protein